MTQTTPGRSMAEQLQPLANRIQKRRAFVRRVSQVFLTADASNVETTFEDARNDVLRWMNNRAGRKLPEAAWAGQSFDMEELGAQRVAAVAIEEPRLWSARLDDADREVPQRTWVTEVAIGESSEGVLFGARLTCVSRGEDLPVGRSVPGFVRQVVESLPMRLDGVGIQMTPSLVTDQASVDELITLIADPKRRHDVVVVALPEDSENPKDALISADVLHLRTLGSAHIRVITGPASFLLSAELGREFSVFRCGVRTYRPGFDLAFDEPYSHPLAVASRIQSWEEKGPEGYADFLVSQLLRNSVSSPDILNVLPDFSEIRRFEVAGRRKRAKEAGSTDSQLLETADEEIKRLEDELADERETAQGLLGTAELERAEALQEAEKWKSMVFGLRRRIASLEGNQPEETVVEIPESLDDLEAWAQTNLAGSVELHNRALKGAKKSLYEDPGLVYRALLLLRDFYVPMKLQGGHDLQELFERECERLGVNETASFSGDRWGEEGDTYIIRYAGRRRLLDRHLKKGNTKDDRYCFRLYFTWDDDSEQAIVGWLPSHLDTRQT